jgi:hypothetical protein
MVDADCVCIADDDIVHVFLYPLSEAARFSERIVARIVAQQKEEIRILWDSQFRTFCSLLLVVLSQKIIGKIITGKSRIRR